MNQSFQQIFKTLETKLKSLKSLSLTTEDGFTVFSATASHFEVEDDKLSAITSSLTALGSAAAKQLIDSEFGSTCIECKDGLLYMIKTRYQEKSCILSLISDKNPNLGQIRYFLNKLAVYLETANLSAENDNF